MIRNVVVESESLLTGTPKAAPLPGSTVQQSASVPSVKSVTSVVKKSCNSWSAKKTHCKWRKLVQITANWCKNSTATALVNPAFAPSHPKNVKPPRTARSHYNNIANSRIPWCNACNYQAVNAANASRDALSRLEQ